MYFVICDAHDLPNIQKDALAEHFGAAETIDWSCYKNFGALKSALDQRSNNPEKYVILTRLSLSLDELVALDELHSVEDAMTLEDAAEFIDQRSRPAKNETAEEEPTVAAVDDALTPGPRLINPAEIEDRTSFSKTHYPRALPKDYEAALVEITCAAVLWVKDLKGGNAAKNLMHSVDIFRIRDLDKHHPRVIAELLAKALKSDTAEHTVNINVNGSPSKVMDAIHKITEAQVPIREVKLPEAPYNPGTAPLSDPRRIPVSLIDPDETELSELKKKFEDQKLALDAYKRNNEKLVAGLDHYSNDLSTLSKSNRELAAENEKLKTELNLKDGEIRNLVSASNLNEPGYHRLAKVLVAAYDQAARGKGKERHANDLPFHEQRMLTISEMLGSPDGMAYQVCKKVQEALDMPTLSQQTRELYGAINYAAGIVIYLENAEFKAEGIARADSI